MPKTVVAISEEGVRNLETYFKVPVINIHKIYNAVKDIDPPVHVFYHSKYVRILYPARINSIKRQLEIIHHLRGRISNNIKIIFAGTGPQAAILESEIVDSPNFVFLGYRSDIFHLLHTFDYIMLFSKQEGLPISLIEADMMGTPAVCNNVGGNTEIIHDGENGFVVNDWNALIRCLNSLSNVSEKEYLRMSLNARSKYLENFTFEAFKKNYLKLLKSLG
jgi:glycosyltransferase involved in cell wall biosynthesis